MREEQVDLTRSRHRRKGSTGLAVVLTVVAVLVAGVTGAGFWGYRTYLSAPDYDGDGGAPVTVTIESGSTLTAMGDVLVAADVVKSVKAFVKAAGDNPKSSTIQAGTFQMKKQMAAAEAVTRLLDPAARAGNGVTINEGWTALRTYETISKATGIPVADFEKAAKDPVKLGVPASWFKRGDGKKVARTVEGFLFPDTYEFTATMTAEQILKTMVQHFLKVSDELDFPGGVTGDRKTSPFEGLIVASLAEAEAGTKEDLGKVARVAYNRLHVTRMPLQFDTTANYWLALNGGTAKHSGELSREELNDKNNPYNTATEYGLPIGPINSPGKAALQAALDPPKGNWLYFVLMDNKTKISAFTADYDQHRRNTDKACANGVALC
ncbi:endolytic transglycosylase MltG [Actinoplanes couchii]|uniref:Endolytic murein transglycosylase n=1 Tax=Actinoplanes couchii TaxID=403638 RepID=A0ABQ3XQX1_9ACTN|nr:endolytic transglycosylase MltG [Actinoplanes couchii]MDR6318863.1 UPF0755 protein [Actinoplanes couchii]GID60893.1 hypothetical protein Aco03nite_092970 [Actinoplanes couchii]